MKTSYMQGWVCPLCGRVFSPHIIMCPYCGPNKEHDQPCNKEIEQTPVETIKKPTLILS